ncbi:MAG: ATP-dependent helicase [Muribaculaceae bacterium]|nr:ATP-dependent helicase [Muribaculaceae bacterium]MDE6754864.1 ATP-dependent helicase [Muribaculaceae bacterium]
MNLNNKQQEAVEATEGRVRVVAGAGSGKTRVLAHRYAFLVNDIGISPGNILCLTFTNKAAQEMKRRISTMVDRGSVNDFICTIHSFCAKFLRREIYRIGYPKNFTIIDEEDGKVLARQAMQEFGVDRRKTTAERFLKGVAALKGYEPTHYIQKHLLPCSSTIAPDATVRYLKLQLKQFALDYDDLLYFTLYILNHFEDARKYWTEKLNYVMVDEVQDCTGDDWKLLHALTQHHGNLFVVGDPDQAIYEWRGANPKIFVDFKANTDIILNQNYRSTPDILDVANHIIEHNKNRVKKELFTIKLNERQGVHLHSKSEKEEAEFIAERIEEGVKEGMRFSDFAILYRSSFLSRHLEQSLLKRHIPYSVWGGVRFFERKEIKDVLSYLRMVATDNDDLSFRRIINLPARKFGEASMKALTKIAEEEHISLMQALRSNIDLKPFNKPQLRNFLNLIDAARERVAIMPVSELTDWLLKECGLADLYRNDEEEERLENLTELMNSMKEFENGRLDEGDADLISYLQEIALYTNADRTNDSEKVRMMTIHQSKGLEFPEVFVVGLTEGIFPNHRSIRERRQDGEEEERRLMYVAVTRAEKMIWLCESEGYMNENGALKYPSRFLSEVPEGMLKIEGNLDPVLKAGTEGLVSMLNNELGQGAEAPLAPGTKVSHKVFGEGIIESYDAASKSYKVKFGGSTRNLLARVLTVI